MYSISTPQCSNDENGTLKELAVAVSLHYVTEEKVCKSPRRVRFHDGRDLECSRQDACCLDLPSPGSPETTAIFLDCHHLTHPRAGSFARGLHPPLCAKCLSFRFIVLHCIFFHSLVFLFLDLGRFSMSG